MPAVLNDPDEAQQFLCGFNPLIEGPAIKIQGMTGPSWLLEPRREAQEPVRPAAVQANGHLAESSLPQIEMRSSTFQA